MDYKKKYEDALEKAKEVYNRKDATDGGKLILEFMFPELKESDDERIRKAIFKALSKKDARDVLLANGIQVSDALTWLEKQGKKDSQVILPTFTFDDILAFQCCMKKVQKDEELYNQLQILHDRLHDAYWLEKKGEQKTNEIHPIFRIGDCIRNKKTSDKVLIEQLDVELKVYYYTCYDGAAVNHSDFPFSKQDEWELIGQKVVEQNHTDKVEMSTFKDKLLELFQKFRWKSTPTNGDIIEYVDTHIQELINTIQKPALSEEDECLLDETIEHLEAFIRISKKHGSAYSDEIQYYQRDIDWLKSLKERCTWKPSDEQMEAFEHFVRSVGESGYASTYDNNTKLLYSLLQQLKKLREK